MCLFLTVLTHVCCFTFTLTRAVCRALCFHLKWNAPYKLSLACMLISLFSAGLETSLRIWDLQNQWHLLNHFSKRIFLKKPFISATTSPSYFQHVHLFYHFCCCSYLCLVFYSFYLCIVLSVCFYWPQSWNYSLNPVLTMWGTL